MILPSSASSRGASTRPTLVLASNKATRPSTIQMGSLRNDILERLRFETELAGPLVPRQQPNTATPNSDRTKLSSTLSSKSSTASPAEATTPNNKQADVTKATSTTSKSNKTTSKNSDTATTNPKAAAGSRTQPSKNISSSDNASDPYQRIKALIPDGSPLLNFSTLDEVERYVANTILIELDRIRKNPVFGVGNPNADLLVIGEAPGANEDEQGEPFVGRAGKLLTDILAAINFSRKDVYIANILKSRPTDNRNPTSDEIAAHVPILHKQITLIRPKLIMCVGKVAANSLLGNSSSLASMRGTFQDYHGLPVLVTYHPAALLRNPKWKRPTWDDVQLLRSKFDELVEKPNK